MTCGHVGAVPRVDLGGKPRLSAVMHPARTTTPQAQGCSTWRALLVAYLTMDGLRAMPGPTVQCPPCAIGAAISTEYTV